MVGKALFWLCVVAALLCFVLAVRPSSGIWRTAFDAGNKRHVGSVVCGTVLVAVLMVPLGHISNQQAWLGNPSFDESIQHVQDGNQYDYLADSLIAGHVSLDLPVSDVLLGMDNPYDTAQRTELNAQARDSIYWDYAYYDGSYYCYFGVLPCLMLFVPAKLLFGVDLRTDIAVLVFAVMFVALVPLLLRAFVKAYGFKPSVGTVWTCLAGLWCCSGIFEQVFLPRLYSVPILSALCFSMAGLVCWLEAKRRIGGLAAVRSGRVLLCAGGFCIAATLACRPQFVLCVLLAFPIFWPEIRRGLFFSKKGAANTALVMAPFVLVAIPVCWYNYARFGSPFDFGAAYNLTGADMTSYTFSLKYMLVRMAEYLALPLFFTGSFPFLQAVNEIQPPGFLWTNEPFYGGMLVLLPFAAVGIALVFRKVRKRIASKGLGFFAVALCVVALAIMAFDSIASGVTMRYFGDFAWLFCMVSVAVLLCVGEGGQLEQRSTVCRWLPTVSACLVLVSLVAYSLSFFGTARIGALFSTNPDLYSLIAVLFF